MANERSAQRDVWSQCLSLSVGWLVVQVVSRSVGRVVEWSSIFSGSGRSADRKRNMRIAAVLTAFPDIDTVDSFMLPEAHL